MDLAVGFDFDHTLGIDNKLERTVGAELFVESAAQVGRELAPLDAERALDDALAAYRNGEAAIDAALESAYAVVVGIAAPASLATSFRARAVARAPAFVEPLPGFAEMLGWLRRRAVRYALLTNGWSPLQEIKARCIGFDGPMLVSDALGVRKPEPAAFARLAELLGERSQRWYVGDDPLADVGGALAAGFDAIWFDWEGHPYPDGLPAPTATIHRLVELATVLQGPGAEAANPVR
ncbi:MAG: HAD family hydrolase [Vulcanimicrobiaceae bacterium]